MKLSSIVPVTPKWIIRFWNGSEAIRRGTLKSFEYLVGKKSLMTPIVDVTGPERLPGRIRILENEASLFGLAGDS